MKSDGTRSRAGSFSGVKWELALYLLAAGAMYLSMRPTGHDFSHHLVRAEEIYNAITTEGRGIVFSRAYADGRQVPTYLFYSQLVYFPAALLKWLGLSTQMALRASAVAYFGAFAWGAYSLSVRVCRLAQPQLNAAGALLRTSVLLAANYPTALLITRLALGELAAAGAIVWCLSGLLNPVQTVRVGVFLPLALALILHPLTVMNCLPLLIVVALFGRGQPRNKLIFLVCEWVIGVALAAFHVFPAFLATSFVRGHEGVPRKVPAFRNWAELLSPAFGISLGWVIPIAAIAGAILFVRRKRWEPFVLAMLLMALAYGFMLRPASSFVWKAFRPLLANIFTFRMLLPLSLSLWLFFAVVLAGSSHSLSRWWGRVGLIFCLLPFAQAIRENPPLTQKQMSAFISHQHVAMKRRVDGFGVGEFLPKVPPAYRQPNDCKVKRAKDSPDRIPVLIDPKVAGDCWETHLYWSPYYEVSVGGQRVQTYAAPKTGYLVFLPKHHSGPVTVSWRFPLRRWMVVISTLAWLTLLGFLLWRWRKKTPTSTSRSTLLSM